MGGDEALKREWDESRAAQDRMAELGLSSADELQSWFIGRMDAFITREGTTLDRLGRDSAGRSGAGRLGHVLARD